MGWVEEFLDDKGALCNGSEDDDGDDDENHNDRHANIGQIKIGRTYVSDLLDLVSPRGALWGVSREKVDICYFRLPENAFANTKTAKNVP